MYYGGGAQTQVNNQSKPLPFPFVSLSVKGRADGFTIKGGDATNGTLDTNTPCTMARAPTARSPARARAPTRTSRCGNRARSSWRRAATSRKRGAGQLLRGLHGDGLRQRGDRRRRAAQHHRRRLQDDRVPRLRPDEQSASARRPKWRAPGGGGGGMRWERGWTLSAVWRVSENV